MSQTKSSAQLQHRTLSALQKQRNNTALGAYGESRAVQFLKTLGWTILEQNLRLGTHEVDIIALTPDKSLVFCEVKTRKSSQFAHPATAITSKKTQSMRLVATTYLRAIHWAGEYRFDALTIVPGKIEHFENITW